MSRNIEFTPSGYHPGSSVGTDAELFSLLREDGLPVGMLLFYVNYIQLSYFST